MPLEGLINYFLIYCGSEESENLCLILSICIVGKCLPTYMCNQDLFLYGLHLIHKYQLIVLQVDEMRERTLVIMLNIFLLSLH